MVTDLCPWLWGLPAAGPLCSEGPGVQEYHSFCSPPYKVLQRECQVKEPWFPTEEHMTRPCTEPKLLLSPKKNLGMKLKSMVTALQGVKL